MEEDDTEVVVKAKVGEVNSSGSLFKIFQKLLLTDSWHFPSPPPSSWPVSNFPSPIISPLLLLRLSSLQIFSSFSLSSAQIIIFLFQIFSSFTITVFLTQHIFRSSKNVSPYPFHPQKIFNFSKYFHMSLFSISFCESHDQTAKKMRKIVPWHILCTPSRQLVFARRQ